jgi:hypothetical protein
MDLLIRVNGINLLPASVFGFREFEGSPWINKDNYPPCDNQHITNFTRDQSGGENFRALSKFYSRAEVSDLNPSV